VEFQNGKSWYTPGSFSYERQAKDLQDTELGRVRSEKKTKDLQNGFLHGKVR